MNVCAPACGVLFRWGHYQRESHDPVARARERRTITSQQRALCHPVTEPGSALAPLSAARACVDTGGYTGYLGHAGGLHGCSSTGTHP